MVQGTWEGKSSSESSLNRVISGRPGSTLIVGRVGRGKVEVEDTQGVRSFVEQGGSESLRPYALYVPGLSNHSLSSSLTTEN